MQALSVKQQNLTILLLEDEAPLRAAIKSRLETESFSVVLARTVNQALDYLKKGLPVDGVWLDHYLSGKQNGLDFVTKLRHDRIWKNLPVFVVSNMASQDTIQAYLNLNVKKRYNKVDYRLDYIVADIKNTLEGSKV